MPTHYHRLIREVVPCPRIEVMDANHFARQRDRFARTIIWDGRRHLAAVLLRRRSADECRELW